MRLDANAKLLDVAFVLPGTNIRYGIDGLIGLIPIVGDLITTAISLWLVREARALGAPWHITARMLANVAVDGVVGMVPLAGDAFDVMFRANVRNVRMLKKLDGQAAARLTHMNMTHKKSPRTLIVRGRVCLEANSLGGVGVRRRVRAGAALQREGFAVVQRTDAALVEARFLDLQIGAVQRVRRQLFDREANRFRRGAKSPIGKASPLLLADRGGEQFGGGIVTEGTHGL